MNPSDRIILLMCIGLVGALVLLGFAALERQDYPPCPNGDSPTAWCGCAPPLNGDDC